MPGASGTRPSENDPGTGPATSVSPARPTGNDINEFNPDSPGLEKDEDGAALEIENEFRRRLAGLRILRRGQKAAAYRSAMEWRRQAMIALRERKLRDRHTAFLIKRIRRRRLGYDPIH
jgi:hypothetical protein